MPSDLGVSSLPPSWTFRSVFQLIHKLISTRTLWYSKVWSLSILYLHQNLMWNYLVRTESVQARSDLTGPCHLRVWTGLNQAHGPAQSTRSGLGSLPSLLIQSSYILLGMCVGPILAQREAYVDLWCSCQIGDAYIDLSIHLFDTYTRSKVNAAPPLNPNLTPRDDRTQSLPYNVNRRSLLNYLWGKHCHYIQESMQLCGSLSKSII